MELVTVSLATWAMVIFVLGLLPFRVHPKLMLLAVGAAGWGSMELYATLPRVCEAAAVAGGVAIVTRLATSELPEPWSLDDFLGRLMELTARKPKKVPPEIINQVRVHRNSGKRIPRL